MDPPDEEFDPYRDYPGYVKALDLRDFDDGMISGIKWIHVHAEKVAKVFMKYQMEGHIRLHHQHQHQNQSIRIQCTTVH